jgi:hypothetical protein
MPDLVLETDAIYMAIWNLLDPKKQYFNYQKYENTQVNIYLFNHLPVFFEEFALIRLSISPRPTVLIELSEQPITIYEIYSPQFGRLGKILVYL